jgi:hypothetical protein
MTEEGRREQEREGAREGEGVTEEDRRREQD